MMSSETKNQKKGIHMTKMIKSRSKKSPAVVTAGRIASFVLFAIAVGFSQAAQADDANPTDNNGGPNNSGYVNKECTTSVDGRCIYKHPNQPSYTSPFD